MKNFTKILGIIVLAAIIGLMTACNSGGGDTIFIPPPPRPHRRLWMDFGAKVQWFVSFWEVLIHFQILLAVLKKVQFPMIILPLRQ